MELEQKEKLLENFKKVYFLLPVPGAASKEKVVDVLSLALSLRKDVDERVEEMLNNLWRKIDGKHHWK